MSFENRIIANLDREKVRNTIELTPAMARAHEKAKNEIFVNSDYFINETDFIPVYGQEIVDADVSFARGLKKEFEERDTLEDKKLKQIADVFEAIVLTQSDSNGWLGNARALKTAPYDDFKNKVDMIAEWFTPKEGSRLLALAVDVTFGAKNVQKKLEAIKEEIDSGKLGSIKYFKDERGDFIGMRNNVPRTIIGVSEPVIEELADLWVQGKHSVLADHPIQRLFLDEIDAQLMMMHDYALKKGKADVVLAYKQVLGIIQPLRDSKAKFRSKKIAGDTVAQEIVLDSNSVFR